MNFDKNDIVFDGDSKEVWVIYKPYTEERRVIGRWKHMRPKTNAKAFVKFLITNFSVEEYFEKRKSLPPLTILEEKGYESPNKKKARLAA